MRLIYGRSQLAASIHKFTWRGNSTRSFLGSQPSDSPGLCFKISYSVPSPSVLKGLDSRLLSSLQTRRVWGSREAAQLWVEILVASYAGYVTMGKLLIFSVSVSVSLKWDNGIYLSELQRRLSEIILFKHTVKNTAGSQYICYYFNSLLC